MIAIILLVIVLLSSLWIRFSECGSEFWYGIVWTILFVSLVCLSISAAYYISTSDLPDWFKFWLLS